MPLCRAQVCCPSSGSGSLVSRCPDEYFVDSAVLCFDDLSPSMLLTCRLRPWLLCRASFSRVPGVSRRSTGYRPMADSGGPRALSTLMPGVPADMGQALGDPTRRRTRSTAHEHRNEGRPSAPSWRRQSVRHPALSCAHRMRRLSSASLRTNWMSQQYPVASREGSPAILCQLLYRHHSVSWKVADSVGGAHTGQDFQPCQMQRLEASQEGRRASVGGRRTSSTFLHSHLAMIPTGSKSGSVLLPGASSMASIPTLQVSVCGSILVD